MCSDGRANRSPNDAGVGNLICLEASSVLAWQGSRGSAGSEPFSHSTWWVMVSDCRRRIMSEGPAWSVYSQLGEKGFPPTNPGFIFLRREGKLGQDRCEDVRNYIVQMYLYVRHSWKKGGHFIQWETWLDACTPASSSSRRPGVFMCLWRHRDPSSAFTGGPSPGPDGFPANAGTAVTHGNRWLTLPPAATTDELTNRAAMQTSVFHSGDESFLGPACHFILGIALFIRSVAWI